MEGAEIHDALIREVIRMLSRPAIFAATLLVSLGLLANARGQTPPQTGAPPHRPPVRSTRSSAGFTSGSEKPDLVMNTVSKVASNPER